MHARLQFCVDVPVPRGCWDGIGCSLKSRIVAQTPKCVTVLGRNEAATLKTRDEAVEHQAL